MTLLVVIIFGPAMTLAQVPTSYTPLAPLPCIPSQPSTDANGNVVPGVDCSKYGGAGGSMTSVDFQGYVQVVFNIAIALAAAAAIFMTVFGGLQYMTTDSWSGKSAGLEKAKNALLGLLLVLTSYIILRTIDPRLVAIPNNLVPNIAKDYKLDPSVGLGSLLDNLSNDATYHDNITTINTNVTNARNSIADLSTKLTDAQNKICADINSESGSSCHDATAAALFCNGVATSDLIYADCQTLRQTNDQLVSTKQTLNLNIGQGEMMAIVQQCTQTGDPTCADDNALQQRIASVYLKYNQTVDPAQAKQLAAYGTYAQATIDIKQQVALVNDKATLTGVTGTINNLSLGTAGAIDPKLNAALAAQKTASIAAINQAVAKYESLPVHDAAILQQLKGQASQTIQNINATTIHTCNSMNC